MPKAATAENNDHQPDREEPSFEASITEVESIVTAMERGSLDLDQALAGFERAVQLLNRCRVTLNSTERRVRLLTNVTEDGHPETDPFPENPGDGDT